MPGCRTVPGGSRPAPTHTDSAMRPVRFPPFRFDPVAGRLWRGDEPVALRPKTFAVLNHLLARPGELVTKDDLLEAAWGDVAVGEDVVRVSIRELRRALGDDPETPRFVETVHGRGYRFVAPLAAEAPPPAPGTNPIVGRDGELAALRAWFDGTRRGARTIGLIAGDAGMGKTTLVDTFLSREVPAAAAWVGRGGCREVVGASEPYLPLLESLGQLAASGRERLRSTLAALAPMWLMQLPGIAPADEIDRLRARTVGAGGERMLRELADWVDVAAAKVPLVLVLEDLHWSDPATLDALMTLAHRRGAARLLVLVTYRPVDAIVADHPLVALRADLLRRGLCSELRLSGLSGGSYLASLAPAPPIALSTFIDERSGGNPFFMAALVNHLIARDVVAPRADGWYLRDAGALAEAGIPDSLRAMLERQLDALDAETRNVLEAASVAGTEFTSQGVAAACGDVSQERVEDRCDALVRQGRFLRATGEENWADGTTGARYGFMHDLYRDVLYHNLPPARRRRLHQAIGERLERGAAGAAATLVPELASHFERARDVDRAVDYLAQAAGAAQSRFADREAAAYIDRALILFAGAPPSPERIHREVMLRLTQGAALLVTRGPRDPELTRSCERVRALCEPLGGTPGHVLALLSLCVFELMRGRLDAAQDLADRALGFAERAVPAFLPAARLLAGLPRCYRGDLAAGALHLARAVGGESLPALAPSFDPHLHALGNLAENALVQLGRPEEALARGRALLAHAGALGHPFALAFAENVLGRLEVLLRRPAQARAHAERALALCREHGLGAELRVRGQLIRGWANAALGDVMGATAELRPQLDAFGQRIGMPLVTSYHLMVAEVAFREGRLDDAQALVGAAAAVASDTGEEIEAAEIARWRACLAGARGAGSEAEAHLLDALETARAQGARWFELRAGVALGAQWHEASRGDEVRRLLGSLVGCFPHALDLPDLVAARTLLDRAA